MPRVKRRSSSEIRAYTSGDNMASDVIYRNVPKDYRPYVKRSHVWANIQDGDSMIADNEKEADNYYTSFHNFQKRNPAFASFRMRRKTLKDKRVQLYFEDTCPPETVISAT